MATMNKEVYALIKSAKNSDAILNAFWEVSPSGKKETIEFLKSQGIVVNSLPKFPTKSLVGLVLRYRTACMLAGVTDSLAIEDAITRGIAAFDIAVLSPATETEE